MIGIKVLYFAGARQATGIGQQQIEIEEPATADGLFEILVEQHPALQPWKGRVKFAVNLQHVAGSTELADGDEVALLPPFEGG